MKVINKIFLALIFFFSLQVNAEQFKVTCSGGDYYTTDGQYDFYANTTLYFDVDIENKYMEWTRIDDLDDDTVVYRSTVYTISDVKDGIVYSYKDVSDGRILLALDIMNEKLIYTFDFTTEARIFGNCVKRSSNAI